MDIVVNIAKALQVEKDSFVFECYYEGMIVADVFPAFGMNLIPDKTPPTE